MGRHLSKRSRLARYDVTLPRQLIGRLKLIRARTGIPIKEWIRSQIQIACDLELARAPGAFWMRPGARIYTLDLDAGAQMKMVPVPLTVAQGGERVWIMEILPDLDVGEGDDGLDPMERHGSILCDLSADEEGQVQLRRVVVASADVMPMDVAYTTGLGAFKTRKARERRRIAAAERMRSNAGRSGGG